MKSQETRVIGFTRWNLSLCSASLWCASGPDVCCAMQSIFVIQTWLSDVIRVETLFSFHSCSEKTFVWRTDSAEVAAFSPPRTRLPLWASQHIHLQRTDTVIWCGSTYQRSSPRLWTAYFVDIMVRPPIPVIRQYVLAGPFRFGSDLLPHISFCLNLEQIPVSDCTPSIRQERFKSIQNRQPTPNNRRRQHCSGYHQANWTTTAAPSQDCTAQKPVAVGRIPM